MSLTDYLYRSARASATLRAAGKGKLPQRLLRKRAYRLWLRPLPKVLRKAKLWR